MPQIGQVQINFNLPENTTFSSIPIRAFIIGLSQRGPIYKPTVISNLIQFLDTFGQPTNEYEFDFFQAVKSTLSAGGVAICYRIPYYDDKKLFESSFEYYITDSSQIGHIQNKYVLQDYGNSSIYYKLFVGAKRNGVGLYLTRIPKEEAKRYYVLKVNDEYYKLFAENNKLKAQKITGTISPEDLLDAKDELTFDYINQATTEVERYAVTIKKRTGSTYDIGLYLTQLEYEETEPEVDEDTIVYDAIYKQHGDSDRFQLLPGAKLTFTPINDFDSAISLERTDSYSNKINLRPDCFTVKEDIDPSQILGVFPIVFGAKDVESLRQVNLADIRTDFNSSCLEIYDCTEESESNINTYLSDYSNLESAFEEFEHSSHFTTNWFETELGKLIDKYVPQDLSDCKNSIGVAFVAIYLDDEHKLDYKILESFYGLVGISTTKLKNIEDLVNNNSNFFHLDIDGEITTEYSIRALSAKSFIYNDEMCIPFISPKANIDGESGKIPKIVYTSDIFSYVPETKYNEVLCKSLLQLHDMLLKKEFLNYSPFDYILAPGITDVLLIESPFEELNSDYIIPYLPSYIDIAGKYPDLDEPEHEPVKNVNVIGLYKLLALYTQFGDKGTIAFADIPYLYNLYIKDRITKCYGDIGEIKKLLSVLNDLNRGTNILPNYKGSARIYDKMYTTFNYQCVDKDKSLTRYHKLNASNRFEWVPCSTVLVYPYVFSDVNDVYAPIAGNRTVNAFQMCHKSLIDTDIQLFKALFDLYGITSLMNNKDNGTFPVQQTTWRSTYSILKQLHAFRIYLAIRRQAYDICKSYLYEPNIEFNRKKLQNELTYMLNQFKEKSYIDSDSNATVSATTQDIDQNQIQVEMIIGIYGAIVKIIVNLNLTDMKIEYIDQ